MVSRVSQMFDRAVVEEGPHGTSCAESSSLLEYLEVVRETLFQLVPLRIAVGCFRARSRPGPFFGHIHHVSDPGCDRFDQHLCTLFLKEGKHVEVAIAFSSLCPKLACNLDDRLHPQAVDFNYVDTI